jgi:hypothetical protein
MLGNPSMKRPGQIKCYKGQRRSLNRNRRRAASFFETPMISREFQITIHARPQEATVEGSLALERETFPTLHVPAHALGTPFAISFERASEALMSLERMFLEPDGSFVWVSAGADSAWQLDGVLYDRDGRLLYVDLKGTCAAEPFERLLRALGWPSTPVMFQLARQAAFLGEAEFRRYAGLTGALPGK